MPAAIAGRIENRILAWRRLPIAVDSVGRSRRGVLGAIASGVKGRYRHAIGRRGRTGVRHAVIRQPEGHAFGSQTAPSSKVVLEYAQLRLQALGAAGFDRLAGFLLDLAGARRVGVMPPLRLVQLGAVDVIERPAAQVIAPPLSIVHNVFVVVVALVDRVGIDGGGGNARPLAGLLQRVPLRQPVLLPAEGSERRAAPRHGAVRPEVGLRHVAAPILRQLLGQASGFARVGYRMLGRVPVGFQALDVFGIARRDLGQLLVAPPSRKSVGGFLDKNPIALLLSLGGNVLQRDPA